MDGPPSPADELARLDSMIAQGEDRLERTRLCIERLARRGLDTKQAWALLFSIMSGLETHRRIRRVAQSSGSSVRPFKPAPSLAALLAPLLADGAKRLALDAGEPLRSSEPDNPTCWLVDRGVVSVRNGDQGGASIEIGMVGAGELLNIPALLGVPDAFAARATLPSEVVEIPALELGAALESNPGGRKLINGFAYGVLAESRIIAACNAKHSLQQRLARWILNCDDLCDQPIATITHDRLAEMHGVRRASITEALHGLEGERAIYAVRGRLAIRDRAALERLSCGCHRLIRETKRLSFPKTGAGSLLASSSFLAEAVRNPIAPV
jgi:CRP-like cAMP-binding protein